MGRGAGRAGSGGGDPSGRLDLEGSLEPAESIILHGMQFPQQRRVRGQRGEPAAPLGTAAVPPPLPKRRRGEVAGEVRMARPGRRSRRWRGGRAGAAGLVLPGEAASGSVWRCQQRCH